MVGWTTSGQDEHSRCSFWDKTTKETCFLWGRGLILVTCSSYAEQQCAH
ncbi:hypothetical protein L917_07330 [Phytophthora nicotianae]|uniref:Uncharacterized protein n=1 Tax=Phytophthora nicotianae TaxID=4792 RepID=W2LDH3_PHYNI|nr:hypothetical protein L917_07330 [Phytophthora nicotianae]